jgi:glycosyltransferase involved in cell wall biosynthesis
MKILFVNTYDPFLEQHGGAAVTRSELGALRQLAEVDTLFGKPLHKRRHDIAYGRLVWDLLRGTSLKYASYNVLHRPKEFFDPYDLIWCNHDFSAYDHETWRGTGKPFIVRKHNAEHRLVRGQGLPSRVERSRVAAFERRLAGAAHTVLHISQVEFDEDRDSKRKQLLRPLVDSARPATILDPHHDNPQGGGWIDVLCVSNFDWPPNRVGIEWFLQHVSPGLGPDVTVHLIGVGSTRYTRPGVVGHGFVDDLSGFYRRARLFACPVLQGAGIKIKVVGALGAGIPVVTTSVGIEGMEGALTSDAAVVANDPEEMAAAIRRLLADETLRGTMARNASTWADDNIVDTPTWQSAVRTILEDVRS